jgi:mono/diheme cytochrome c family protein
MRWLVLLAVLVRLLAGCGSSTHPETLAQSPVHDVPSWVLRERLPERAVSGARLFATAGCTACHTYAGSGSRNLGAPDLTAIGSRHLGIAFEIAHLKCPSCVNPGSPMPPFASLGKKRLRDVAIFLEASKGTR